MDEVCMPLVESVRNRTWQPGAASEKDGRPSRKTSFPSVQLTIEYVSVRKLGDGDAGRVTVRARGTALSAPSMVSMSASSSNCELPSSYAGSSDIVTNGEPRTDPRSLLKRGDGVGVAVLEPSPLSSSIGSGG